MNHEPRTPENPSGLDDQTLGEALGEALRARGEAPAARPPVSSIAERAAARSRARNTQRAVVGIAASLALVAGGVAAWNALEDDRNTEVLVAGQPAADPAADPAPAAAEPSAPGGPAASVDTSTPQSLSTGPALEWAELDTSELAFAHGLSSTGDGRAMVQAPSPDGDKLLVSHDGRNWTPLSAPAGVAVSSVEISGSRWLVSGWRSDGVDTEDVVLYSDNDGADWTEVELPPSDPSEQAQLAAALVNGSDIVVAVRASDQVDAKSVIASRGLVSHESEITGWTMVEGNTVSFTRDLDSPVESFDLTPQEQELLFVPRSQVVRFYHSQGDPGPAQLTAEYPAWAVSGRSASDGFRFALSSDEGDFLLTTVDGRAWDRSPLENSPGVFSPSATYMSISGGVVWTSGSDAGELRIDRGDGSYSPGLVAEKPEGIGWVQHLAVGPAGVAALAEPGMPAYLRVPEPPSLVVSKDGFELRLNEPPGGATLLDSASQAPVLEISAEEMAAELPPAGIRYVEDSSVVEDPSGDVDLIVFEDPATGEVLVSFTQDEIDAATPPDDFDPGQSNPLPPSEQWIGWTADDGQSWGWQSAAEAFGVPEGSEASIELAVGTDFVIARVETYQVASDWGPEDQASPVDSSDPELGEGGVQAGLEAQPARWFIAALT
ncbi:MAG: hypothetical protein OXF04_11970 [bacterium]|nr:hypothetical protein [bacterium]